MCGGGGGWGVEYKYKRLLKSFSFFILYQSNTWELDAFKLYFNIERLRNVMSVFVKMCQVFCACNEYDKLKQLLVVLF